MTASSRSRGSELNNQVLSCQLAAKGGARDQASLSRRFILPFDSPPDSYGSGSPEKGVCPGFTQPQRTTSPPRVKKKTFSE